MITNLLSIALVLSGSLLIVASVFIFGGKLASLFVSLPFGLVSALPLLGTLLLLVGVWVKYREEPESVA